jgi:hypothetical protein
MNRDEMDGSAPSNLKLREEEAAGDVVHDGTLRSTAALVGEVAVVILLRLGQWRWSDSIALLALFTVMK